MGIIKKYQKGGPMAPAVKKPLVAKKPMVIKKPIAKPVVKPQPKLVDKNSISHSITPTDEQGVRLQNQTTLTPGNVTNKNHSALNDWNPAYDSNDGTKLSSDKANTAVTAERDSRNEQILKFRQGVQKNYSVDPSTMGVNDTIDPNANYPAGHAKEGQRMIPQKALDKYYDNLKWKNSYRQRAGFTQKEYYGAKEAKQQGYTQDTPLEDLNFGYRMVTGSQKAPRLAKGGILNKPAGDVTSYERGGKMCTKCKKKSCTCKKEKCKCEKGNCKCGPKLSMKRTITPRLLMKKTLTPTGYKKPKK